MECALSAGTLSVSVASGVAAMVGYAIADWIRRSGFRGWTCRVRWADEEDYVETGVVVYDIPQKIPGDNDTFPHEEKCEESVKTEVCDNCGKPEHKGGVCSYDEPEEKEEQQNMANPYPRSHGGYAVYGSGPGRPMMPPSFLMDAIKIPPPTPSSSEPCRRRVYRRT